MADGAIAAAAAVATAVKASGVLVQLEPDEFEKILRRAENPLVVVAEVGLFRTAYQYLMGYKGLAFYCRSKEPFSLPAGTEIVRSMQIWIP